MEVYLGAWDTWRQNLLKNDNLGSICKSSGLIYCLNGNPRNPIHNPSNGLAATLLEAIIGAIDKDGNIHDVMDVMETLGLIIPNMVKYLSLINALGRSSIVLLTFPKAHCTAKAIPRSP